LHTYSTDNDTRLKVIAGLGALSYLLIRVAQAFLSGLTASLPLGVSVSAPSFALTWGVIYTIFNNWLWKWNVLRYLKVVQVPNLAGTWDGYLETSYQGDIPDEHISDDDDPNSNYTRLNAEIEIEQKWRKIDVHLKTDRSSSDSNAGTILINESQWPSLNYQYDNEPAPDTPSSMAMHHGTADLELNRENGDDVLEGVYYTGPGRENHGKMRFARREETKNGTGAKIATYLPF
jgi:hypothetical protein